MSRDFPFSRPRMSAELHSIQCFPLTRMEPAHAPGKGIRRQGDPLLVSKSEQLPFNIRSNHPQSGYIPKLAFAHPFVDCFLHVLVGSYRLQDGKVLMCSTVKTIFIRTVFQEILQGMDQFTGVLDHEGHSALHGVAPRLQCVHRKVGKKRLAHGLLNLASHRGQEPVGPYSRNRSSRFSAESGTMTACSRSFTSVLCNMPDTYSSSTTWVFVPR